MSDLELGTRVTFTQPLYRTCPSAEDYTTRVWRGNTFAEPQAGVIVGVRTLSDGVVHWTGDSDIYAPTRHFKAYLIAFDLRRVPVFVLPENVTLTSDVGHTDPA